MLGSFQLLCDGRPVPVRGEQATKLLALLALKSPHPVGIDVVREAIWEDDPPRSADRMVQNLAGRVRRGLAECGSAAMKTGKRTWSLPHVATDIADLDRLGRKARQAHLSGRHEAEADHYVQALGLIRGEPLSGISGDVFTVETVRVNSLIVSIRAGCVEALAETGQTARALPLADELLAMNPHSVEAVHAAMTAHYCNDDVPAATGIFTDYRNSVATETGLDPGRELQSLHAKILRREPIAFGDAKATGHSARGEVRPAELPRLTASFTGREEELEKLSHLLVPGGPPVVVSGPGGIGKTALAVEAAQGFAERFEDGQMYIDLRGFSRERPVEPQEALSRMLNSLGVATSVIPTGIEASANLLRTKLAERSILLVLDNARSEGQVEPLLPGAGLSQAVVTSRHRLQSLHVSAGARAMKVGPLSTVQAQDMLARLMEARADDAALRKLGRKSGGFPLAICLMASNLIHTGADAIEAAAEELSSGQGREFLRVGGNPGKSVEDAFNVTLRALDPDARRSALELALIPGADLSQPLIRAVLGPESSESVLESLEEASLIDQYRFRRYRFHDLVRDHLRLNADTMVPSDRKEEVACAVARWYGDKSHLDVQVEVGNIMAVMESYAESFPVWKILGRSREFLRLQRDVTVLRPVIEHALSAARRAEDLTGQAVMWEWRSKLSAVRGEMAEAVRNISRARELIDRTSDPVWQAEILGSQGMVMGQAGDTESARELLEASLDAARRLGDGELVLHQLIYLANAYRRSAHVDRSKELLKEARSVGGTVRPTRSNVRLRELAEELLAELLIETGETAEGGEMLDRLFRTPFETVEGRGRTLTVRARLRIKIGDHAGAWSDAEEAYDIGSQHEVYIVLRRSQFLLADLAAEAGDLTEARWYADAHGADGAENSKLYRARRSEVLCTILARTGDMEAALEHGSTACSLYEEMAERVLLPEARKRVDEALAVLAEQKRLRDGRPAPRS